MSIELEGTLQDSCATAVCSGWSGEHTCSKCWIKGHQIFQHILDCMRCDGSRDNTLSWIGLFMINSSYHYILSWIMIVSYHRGWVNAEWLMDAGFTLRQDKSIYIAIDTVQCAGTWEVFYWTQSKLQRKAEKQCLKAWIFIIPWEWRIERWRDLCCASTLLLNQTIEPGFSATAVEIK